MQIVESFIIPFLISSGTGLIGFLIFGNGESVRKYFYSAKEILFPQEDKKLLSHLISGKIYRQHVETSWGDTYSQLLEMKRRQGGEIKSAMRDLQRLLFKDCQFQKERSEFLVSGLLQNLALILLAWGMRIITAELIQEINFSFIDLSLLLFQMIGLFLYLMFILNRENKILAPCRKVFQVLVKLDILSRVSLSTKELKTWVGDALPEPSALDKELKTTCLLLHSGIERWRSQGTSLGPLLKDLIDDMGIQMIHRFETLKRKEKVIRMLVLIVFQATAYFFMIGRLLGSFVVEQGQLLS